jgi:hypothetical protein
MKGSSRGSGARPEKARSGTGVKRDKMKVQWTFIPLNGFTRDGEPRAFKRTGMG